MARSKAPVRSGDVVDVRIERLATGGRGIARHENFVLFVGRGLPGDLVRARITRVKRSFAEAIAVELLEAGETTITAPCAFLPECGGCAWQRLDYGAQLEAKHEQVRDALERIAGIAEPPLLPIIPAVEQFGYRNKVEYTFAQNDDEELVLGFHMAGRWDQVIGVDPCLIADPRGIAAHRTVLAWARETGYLPHDRESGEGMLGTLTVRVGRNTGQVQVNLLTGPVPKSGLNKLAELIDDLQLNVPGIVGVLHTVTNNIGDGTSEELPPEILWGRDWFEETLAGETLRVRPESFLQTNTAMAEVLYDLVRDVAQLRPDDIAWDLYCGIGSITLMLARHVEAVVGVEVVAEAIDCARENAELNNIENVEFQVGNVRPILKFAKGVWPDPTLIVVDPPRSGLVQKVVRRICQARPERIIYVSCNPATFAGNLPWFAEHGYEMVSVQSIDQFPHTHHVELVARLEPIEGWVPPENPEP